MNFSIFTAFKWENLGHWYSYFRTHPPQFQVETFSMYGRWVTPIPCILHSASRVGCGVMVAGTDRLHFHLVCWFLDYWSYSTYKMFRVTAHLVSAEMFKPLMNHSNRRNRCIIKFIKILLSLTRRFAFHEIMFYQQTKFFFIHFFRDQSTFTIQTNANYRIIIQCLKIGMNTSKRC